jgi:hypothetical protein
MFLLDSSIRWFMIDLLFTNYVHNAKDSFYREFIDQTQNNY